MNGAAIGARLREERERLGYTQEEFAEIVGSKRRALIEWEKGNTSPTLFQLDLWAGVGVDSGYVVTGLRQATGAHRFTWKQVEDAGHGMLTDGGLIGAINIDSRQTYEFLLSLLMRNLTKVTGYTPSEETNDKANAKAG